MSMLVGGVSDKLGNGYEAQWTLLEALNVLQARADEIRTEPFNEHAAGLEFRVNANGRKHWHQCKRRVASGSWTMRALDSEGVLRAFAGKLIDPSNNCVFVSSDPAASLKSLVEKARLAESAVSYLEGLSGSDRRERKVLLESWAIDPDTELDWLKRCRVEIVSEDTMNQQFESRASLLFEADVAVARSRILGFLSETITQTITTDRFREAVDGMGLNWKARLDPTLGSKLVSATDEYLATLPLRISGEDIQVQAVDEAVALAMDLGHSVTVIAGSAGGGKSVALARTINCARSKGRPTLAFRIDQFLSCSTVEEIGSALLGRAESPVGIIGNRYGNEPCLLVIDQVDAISEASGRTGRIRNMLFRMLDDAQLYPNLKLVIACRTFDLERDSRLRPLAEHKLTRAITLPSLNWDEAVSPVLVALGLGERVFTDRERAILSVPINLMLFSVLAREGSELRGNLSSSKLFDALMELRARNLRDQQHSWTPQSALGAMAAYMSENQSLTAPIQVLDAFSGAAEALQSLGLISSNSRFVQFAHESFFDQVFARLFIAKGQSVVDLLLSDEQRLFRRTQVRQIFARLRETPDQRRYLRELNALFDRTEIRYLVKDAAANWLADVDSPTVAEFEIVRPWLAPAHGLRNLARAVLHGRNWIPITISSGAMMQWVTAGDEERNLALSALRSGASRHPAETAAFLRDWWSGRADRRSGILAWLSNLYPDGEAIELEKLYGDLISSLDNTDVALKLTENFSLGSWSHRNKALGARVLGMWLKRWQLAYPNEDPFADLGGDQMSNYWMKELAEHAPEAFVGAVLPAFVDALAAQGQHSRRSRLRLPYDEDDQPILALLAKAIATVAANDPGQVSTYLDAIAPADKATLYLHLKAIAANGEVLGARLVSIMKADLAFDVGEWEGGWEPFALAAKAAFPHYANGEQLAVEQFLLSRRPEIEWASKYYERSKSASDRDMIDVRRSIIRELNRSGDETRAILSTIGRDSLSAAAALRLDELARKFGDQPLPIARGVQGGWVQSPIAPERAKHMSDKQWLSAMNRYTSDDHRRYGSGWATGGSRQLGDVLQAQAKENPARFVDLMERLPASTNPEYPESILNGVADSKPDPALLVRCIRACAKWPEETFHRSICWAVQKCPNAARDREVLSLLLRVAEFGSASDTAVQTVGKTERATVGAMELLRGDRDIHASGINGERGSAYEALAIALWEQDDALPAIAELLDRRIGAEPLPSVLVCMLHTVNSVANHDTQLAIRMLIALAARDLTLLQSHSGRHILRWATATHFNEVAGVVERLEASDDRGLRALGLFLSSGIALSRDSASEQFAARFPDDALCRQVAVARGTGNISPGNVGDRAVSWLLILANDAERLVRAEFGHLDWRNVFDCQVDRTNLAEAFLASKAFEDQSDRIVSALVERVDRFPDLAFKTLNRILELYSAWQERKLEGHHMTVHYLGRLLVELYRTLGDNPARETQLLDLFDTYLAHDQMGMRDELNQYERL